MVHAMRRHPSGGRILQAPYRDDRECVLEPERALEAAVREQPVIAKIHSESAEEIYPDERQPSAGRAVEPGDERQQRKQVVAPNRERISPIDPPLTCTDRKRQ